MVHDQVSELLQVITARCNSISVGHLASQEWLGPQAGLISEITTTIYVSHTEPAATMGSQNTITTNVKDNNILFCLNNTTSRKMNETKTEHQNIAYVIHKKTGRPGKRGDPRQWGRIRSRENVPTGEPTVWAGPDPNLGMARTSSHLTRHHNNMMAMTTITIYPQTSTVMRHLT